MTDLKKLRELAEKATPGERYTRDYLTLSRILIRTSPTREAEVASVYCESPRYDAPDRQRWNDEADFIAALDRETVLALLDVVDAAAAYMDARGDDNETFVRLGRAVRRIRDGQGGGDGDIG